MSSPRSRSRRHRLTRRDSEHLLDGRGGDPGVARLLADAARFAPGEPLHGEETAIAAFRAAAYDLPASGPGRCTSRALPASRPRASRSAPWGTALATLGAGSTVAVLGGLMLAAVGAMPEPWQVTAHHEASSVSSAGTDADGSPTAGRGGSAGQATTPAGAGPAAPTRRDRHHTDRTPLEECRRWWRGGSASAGPALREAAGGAEHVAGYCNRVAVQACAPDRSSAGGGRPAVRCPAGGRPTSLTGRSAGRSRA